MGCYRCGSEQGDESRLCPNCAERRMAERRGRVDEMREEYQAVDTAHEVFQSPLVRGAACVAAVMIGCIVSLLGGPFAKSGAGPSLVFGGMLGFAAISAVTWAFFWMRLMVMEPTWALASFLFPGFVYRYVMLEWDESRVYFFIHIGCVVLTLLSAGLLSSITDKAVWEILSIYQLYTHGQSAEVHRYMSNSPYP